MAQGATVKGIELSTAMVQKLRKKETGPSMEVVIGDMTT
ncbi:MAG: class I SAM-dependent methyltransferase, partial [Chloroflexota bacterium]